MTRDVDRLRGETHQPLRHGKHFSVSRLGSGSSINSLWHCSAAESKEIA